MSSLPTALECVWLWASPPLDAFWCWSRDHEALEWADADAGTLLLRSELQDFVRHRVTAGRGLPPLQLVVVLLALLRDPKLLQRHLRGVELPNPGTLWQQVRNAPNLRLHLIDAVTWAAKSNSLEFAARVAEGLDVVLPVDHLAPRDFRALPLAEAVELLRFGLRAVTPERLALWAKTGLAELPQPAALPQPRGARELLAQLAGDPRFGGLVGVVRQLQAALRVSSRPLRRDEQATDGFVGVGNRGPLDRLLPSELAHDDDVLAVRIATNEALYVQREAPPRRPRARRRILLDDGVRMWGTPRVLGVAVALAFLASAPRDLEVEVWRNHGGRLERIELASRNDLVQQLGCLDLALDARAVLPAFWAGGDAALVESMPADAHDEAIVVAHPDSVADAQFCPRALAALPRQRRHLVGVDEFGLCTMAELTAHGREVGGQVALHLPDVWPTTSPPATAGRLPVPEFCRGPMPCPEPPPSARHAALFAHAIAVAGGRICLRRRGSPQALVRVKRRVVFSPFEAKDWEQFPWHPFAPVVGAEETPTGEPFAMADLGPRWRVFVDGRGFLHFMPVDSSDGEEVTIPLIYSREPLVGWRHAWLDQGRNGRRGSFVGGPCADRELWALIERIVREAS